MPSTNRIQQKIEDCTYLDKKLGAVHWDPIGSRHLTTSSWMNLPAVPAAIPLAKVLVGLVQGAPAMMLLLRKVQEHRLVAAWRRIGVAAAKAGKSECDGKGGIVIEATDRQTTNI